MDTKNPELTGLVEAPACPTMTGRIPPKESLRENRQIKLNEIFKTKNPELTGLVEAPACPTMTGRIPPKESLWENRRIKMNEIFKTKNPGLAGLVEAPVGFEPTNKAFAELPLKPLGYSAI